MREKKKEGLERVIFEIYGDKGEVFRVGYSELLDYMIQKRKGLFYIKELDQGIFFDVPYSGEN